MEKTPPQVAKVVNYLSVTGHFQLIWLAIYKLHWNVYLKSAKQKR